MSQSMIMPGCGPGDLTALNQCYDDLSNASDLISALMIDLINNNPAVAQAMVDAIQRFGLSIPQVGVTDGSDPTAGNIGQWFTTTTNFSVTQNPQTQLILAGTLPAGDWDLWAQLSFSLVVYDVQLALSAPTPPGIAGNMALALFTQSQLPPTILATPATRASITAGTGIVFQLLTNQFGPGVSGNQGTLVFMARRRR